jgi:hypothetical protein
MLLTDWLGTSNRKAKSASHSRRVDRSGGTICVPAEILESRQMLSAVVGAVTPNVAPTDGGTMVSIYGTGFNEVSAVMFGNIPADTFFVESTETIRAFVPSQAAGTVDISVITSDGVSASTAEQSRFTYTSTAPRIVGINSNYGPHTGGDPVTIAGTSFYDVTAVTFGSQPAESFYVLNSYTIMAISPASAAVAVNIFVHTTHGTAISEDVYQYYWNGVEGDPPPDGSGGTGDGSGGTGDSGSGGDSGGDTELPGGTGDDGGSGDAGTGDGEGDTGAGDTGSGGTGTGSGSGSGTETGTGGTGNGGGTGGNGDGSTGTADDLAQYVAAQNALAASEQQLFEDLQHLAAVADEIGEAIAAADALAQADYDAAVAAANDEFNAAIDAAQAEYDAAIAAADAELEQDTAAADAELADAQAAIDATFDGDLAAAGQILDEAVALAQAEYNGQVEGANQEYDDTLAAANQALQTAIDAINATFDATVVTINADLAAAYEAAAAAKTMALATAATTHATEIAGHTQQFDNSLATLRTTRDTVVSSYPAVVFNPDSVAEHPDVAAARAAAAEALAAALAAAQQTFDDTRDAVAATYEAALQSAQAQLAQTLAAATEQRNQALLAAKSRRDESAANAATAQAIELDTIRATYMAAKAEADAEYQRKKNTAEAACREEVAEAQEQRDEDVAQVNAAYNTWYQSQSGTYGTTTNQRTARYSEDLSGVQAQYNADYAEAQAALNEAVRAAELVRDGKVNAAQQILSAATTAAGERQTARNESYSYRLNAAQQAFQNAISGIGANDPDYAHRHDTAFQVLLAACREYAIDMARSEAIYRQEVGAAELQYEQKARDAATALVVAVSGPTATFGARSNQLAKQFADQAADLKNAYLKDIADLDIPFLKQVEQKQAERDKAIAGFDKTLEEAKADAARTRDDAIAGAENERQKAYAAAEKTQANAQIAAAAAYDQAVAAADVQQSNDEVAAEVALWAAQGTAVATARGSVKSATNTYASGLYQARMSYALSAALAEKVQFVTIVQAQSQAIINASSGDPDVMAVATAWLSYQLAAADAWVGQILSETAADNALDQAQLDAEFAADDAGFAAEREADSQYAAAAVSAVSAAGNAEMDFATAVEQAAVRLVGKLAAADEQLIGRIEDALRGFVISANGAVRRAVGSELTAALQYAGRLITATAKNFNSAADAGLKLAKDESNAGANWLKQIVQADRQRSDAGVQARTAQLPRAAAEDAKIGVGRMRVAVDQVNRDSQENIRILVAQSLVAFANLSTLPTLAIPTIASRLSAFGNWLYNDGLDHATNFVTGIADTISFGGTRKYREYFGMDYVDYNSWMYMGGTLVGTAIGVGLGGGAGGICNGGRLILAARTYTQVSTFVGMAQVAYKWRNGEPIGVTDALAFAPAAGWAVGRVGKALGAWGCFVADTGVHMAPVGQTTDYAMLTPTDEPDEPVGGVWFACAGTLVALGLAGQQLERRRRKQREWNEALDDVFAQGAFHEDEPDPADDAAAPAASHDQPAVVPLSIHSDANRHDSEYNRRQTHPANALGSRKDTPVNGTHRHRPRLSFLWLFACLVGAGLCTFKGLGGHFSQLEPTAMASVAGVAPRTDTKKPLIKPIQDIQVGEWVLADNPTGEEDLSLGDEVDPATWKRLELRAPKEDGSYADVVLLRPQWWLDEQESRVGGSVYISVPECGIDGNAELLSIAPCPEISTRPSRTARVVTGTFKHQSARVIDLYVEGLSEPIGTTGNHPFWSEDRQQFVRANDLLSGERLRTFDGTPRVTRLVPRMENAPVYNLEIQTEHVYHVCRTGLLVHNGYVCKPKSFDWQHIWNHHHPSGEVAAARLAAQQAGSSRVVDFFPAGWTMTDIQHAVKNAVSGKLKNLTQQTGADGAFRIKYRGVDSDSGTTIEFWYNKTLRLVETAYPKN